MCVCVFGLINAETTTDGSLVRGEGAVKWGLNGQLRPVSSRETP